MVYYLCQAFLEEGHSDPKVFGSQRGPRNNTGRVLLCEGRLAESGGAVATRATFATNQSSKFDCKCYLTTEFIVNMKIKNMLLELNLLCNSVLQQNLL